MITAEEVIIETKDLSVSYGRHRALSNIFMTINKGHIYGVLGPNGAGKSTLFKAILGLVEPDNGTIRVFGQRIDKVRNRLVYIPQKDGIDWQFPATVKDVVMMGRFPHKRVWQRLDSEDKEKTNQALKKLKIWDLRDRQIGELSGGQQQRTFIARALCQDADCFLMDEPFVGVDLLTEQIIIDLLREMVKAEKTFLVVHHDLTSAERYFDRTILLNQHLIAMGETSETLVASQISKAYGGQLTLLNKALFR